MQNLTNLQTVIFIKHISCNLCSEGTYNKTYILNLCTKEEFKKHKMASHLLQGNHI